MAVSVIIRLLALCMLMLLVVGVKAKLIDNDELQNSRVDKEAVQLHSTSNITMAANREAIATHEHAVDDPEAIATMVNM